MELKLGADLYEIAGILAGYNEPYHHTMSPTILHHRQCSCTSQYSIYRLRTSLYTFIDFIHSLLYTNIDQKFVNSLQGLLNCEIGGLDCHVITTVYRTRVHCIHMYHLVCNAIMTGPCY